MIFYVLHNILHFNEQLRKMDEVFWSTIYPCVFPLYLLVLWALARQRRLICRFSLRRSRDVLLFHGFDSALYRVWGYSQSHSWLSQIYFIRPFFRLLWKSPRSSSSNLENSLFLLEREKTKRFSWKLTKFTKNEFEKLLHFEIEN